ncbi:MAG TPA: patatin-like phospholipase family protein [Sphingomonadaceae bacterium]|nr:patatin-like phospholipase family protein [Sphingomonadaceae bacterium]
MSIVGKNRATSAAPSGGKPPAYAIFEGGGAKGITHVGALRAFRESYWLVGAAGASAGAIIAALAAVGYQADDLFDEANGTDILTRNGTSPLGLLGRRRWLLASWVVSRLSATLALTFWSLLALVVMIRTGNFSWWPLAAVSPAVLLIFLVFLLWPVMLRGGFLKTDEMRDQLDRLLRARLETLYKTRGVVRQIGDYVTFEDMDPAVIQDACSLKIVVTDARKRRLVQFDQSYKKVSVADAVAASAALPLIFSPPRIRGLAEADQSVFVDGGLVSNLPVWAFVSEKKMFERASTGGSVPIFAFTLNATSGKKKHAAKRRSARERRGFWRSLAAGLWWLLTTPILLAAAAVRWLAVAPFRLVGRFGNLVWRNPFHITDHVRDVLETGIFGSQTVVQDFVTDLRIVEMASPLTTVAFGCTREEATRAHKAGYDRASSCLTNWREDADATTSILDELLPDIENEVATRRVARGAAGAPKLRLSIVDPTKGGFYQVTASVGMQDDPDDRMEFDPRSAAAPAVFKTKLATLAPYDDTPASIGHVMTKYERALLERHRQWVVSIPIYQLVNGSVPATLAERVVERVLCVDSDDDLQAEFADATFVDALSNIAVVLAN